jgi:hypothetical protein
MKASTLLLAVGALALAAAGMFHVHAIRRLSQLDAAEQRLQQETNDRRRFITDTSAQIAAVRHELDRLAAERLRPLASTGSSSATAAPASSPNPLARVVSPELRQLQVQAFVSEQRLRFAALLKRLGLDASQLREFDRIQEECQRTLLDDTRAETDRKQAHQRRDAQLQELFGPAYDQWLEASRTEPARALVARIVQQTFQGSGALTTTQAEQLARVFDGHRVQASQQRGANAARYDWDAVVSDARAILADRQMQDFAAAIEYQRASEQMSAMATARKP